MAFWRNYYHLVWATSNRNPWILPEYEQPLYAYLVKKAAELEVYVYAVNGMQEHLHVVSSIPPKQSVAWVVKNLKGASSHFINDTFKPTRFHFAWQRGYGCLTMGETQRQIAIDYVLKQKQHHQACTTNSWLERDSDLDEGSVEESSSATTTKPPERILREDPPTYSAHSPFPF